ncbi:hypothetical protein M2390_001428 [Mycetocola sp. BIGb0189]|uniref:NAD(P)H-dependent oxidoreductase n=1 Tax=Mycetocola sp. BIGb0189 TaxID=2940604 RepID=UPI002168CC44|nr:NAD(P)H-dependent oxidoreductase [Mycetocola sp. BIGb0189]MCS4276246.1 hypothetical protein [Mycetocola sp. BIGb0189]
MVQKKGHDTKVLMVFDHPYGADASENIPHLRSFSAAIAAAARRGQEKASHEVDLIDLHADGFDPVMHESDLAAWRQASVVDAQVADYQARLRAADHPGPGLSLALWKPDHEDYVPGNVPQEWCEESALAEPHEPGRENPGTA